MSAQEVLRVEDLVIAPRRGGRSVVDGVSLAIGKSEVLALIGESGSGKTTIALAALGYVRPGLAVRRGRIAFGSTEMLKSGERALRSLRGRRVTYVAQSAAASFNPALRLDYQVIEPARVHGSKSAEACLGRAERLYRRLDLPDPERIGRRYPHEVSGGQLQRFMIAMGLIEGPELIVCDEPTSSLDVTTQVEVLKALSAAIREEGTAALFVSHDLAVVAQIADRIIVMHDGRIVEQGATAEILHAPREPYTRALVAACRRWSAGGTSQPPLERAPPAAAPLLRATGVVAGFGPRAANGLPATIAVDKVELAVARGQVVAVIGESGSGKSTLAQVIAGLHLPVEGEIWLENTRLGSAVARRNLEQRRRIQVIFQMADTALNPRHSIGRILGRALKFFSDQPHAERRRRIDELLAMVKLRPEYARRWPGQLSGGEKQRVNLARALAAEPDVLICDEITSALDTIVAAAIVRLIEDLRDRLGLAIVFISHDLATVATLAERISVMRMGRIVEEGPAASVLSQPSHPYTRLLVSSVPELRTGWLEEAAKRREALAPALVRESDRVLSPQRAGVGNPWEEP
jgi:peptide/nickel transport system ATP-binding protein